MHATLQLDDVALLSERGQHLAALDAARSLLATNPSSTRIIGMYGRAALDAGCAVEAASVLAHAVQLHRGWAPGWRLLGEAHLANGERQSAVDALKTAIELDPDQVTAWLHLATAVSQAHDPVPAHTVLTACAGRFPLEPEPHANLAVVCEQLRRLDDAETHARWALKLQPDQPRARMVLARVHRQRGQHDEARRHLQGVIEQPDLPMELAIAARFELAPLLDQTGDCDAAWAMLQTGHRLRRQLAAFQRCDRLSTPMDLARARTWAQSARLPCPIDEQPPGFVVGFPRSGTTLVQQLLEAHPDLRTQDEIPLLQRITESLPTLLGRAFNYPNDLQTLTVADRRNIIAVWRTAVDRMLPRPGRVIDKLPLNFAWLPLALTLFPDAKVLMVVRDPRDVMTSAIYQNFVPNDAMVHLSDLHSAARLYCRVMETWDALRLIPNVNTREQRYEDLLDDPETVARDMLAFFGCAWAPEVLDFHVAARTKVIATPSAQAVSEPINRRALGRWRRHERPLRGVQRVLEPWLDRFGYRA
ncbi:MAG: Flp pilus assembly protein TadD [Kiritimatiellia bacterium]|jgi:Flp pilus assembly protein TadD